MKKGVWITVFLLAISIGAYSIVQYLFIGADKAGLVMTKLKNMEKLGEAWYVFLYLHIILGIFPLVVGPVLFSEKFRQKNIQAHRNVGKVYFMGIFISGLAGLYLAWYATGGWISGVGFSSLSIVWMTTAYMAIKEIRQKNVIVHRKWMIRNYALTFAGVTLRVWLPLFITLFGFENFENSYRVISWLCWVPNLIVAELYIKNS